MIVVDPSSQIRIRIGFNVSRICRIVKGLVITATYAINILVNILLCRKIFRVAADVNGALRLIYADIVDSHAHWER